MPTPLHFLVTAGPTREAIDDVRDWGNIFTGTTGLDLARAFLHLGSVTLLTSNQAHAREFDGYTGTGGMMGVETFKSHADLQSLLEERMTGGGATGPGDKIDVVAMTAAVADYKPAGVYQIVERKPETPNSKSDPNSEISNLKSQIPSPTREIWVVENISAPKFKSSYTQIAIAGTRTPKLIDRFRTDWSFRGILIKFKLEVGLTDAQLVEVASASRLHSRANLIVANTLAMARPANGTEGGAYLIDDTGPKWVNRSQLTVEIREWVQRCLIQPIDRHASAMEQP